MDKVKIIGLLLLLSLLQHAAAQTELRSFNQHWQSLLNDYVSDQGVAYANIPSESLDSSWHYLSTITPSQLDSSTQTAFWINTYNFLVVYDILQAYPIKSVQDIPAFFTEKRHLIGGEKLSLDDIEKEKLWKHNPTPLFHFALNCGARSCPPLSPVAYKPTLLDQQLQQNFKRAQELDLVFVKTHKGLLLSSIFDWYAIHFKPFGGPVEFINAQTGNSFNRNQIKGYMPYDWALNKTGQEVDNNGIIYPYRAAFVLAPAQVELKIFNSLYTQTANDGFQRRNSRSSYFSSYFQTLVGIDKRWNIGTDIVVKSNVEGDYYANSPFKTLTFKRNNSFQIVSSSGSLKGDSNLDTLRNQSGEPILTRQAFGITHIGPKFRYLPFRKLPNLTIQQTLYIPIPNDFDKQWTSFTQLFYDKALSPRHQLFIEASLWWNLYPEFRVFPFFKGFLSYFPNSKWTLYGMTTFPLEYGVGTKYLLKPTVEVELLYTYYLPLDFILGGNRPYTVNLGFRITP